MVARQRTADMTRSKPLTSRTPARKAPADRKRLIAAIHAAAAQLGLDTADKNPASEYRQMLQRLGGASSSTAIADDGLRRVVAHLQRRLNPNAAYPPAQGHTQADEIRRRWQLAAQAGAISDASDESLRAFCKRMTGADDIRWITALQGSRIIEALKAMHARHARR